MSGLPATFPCPWCGMSYPAKPVLIGKPVRCKGCRNAFILQPDGTALKHEDPPPAPAPKPAAPAPAPPPAPKPAAPPPAPAPAPRPVVPAPAVKPAAPAPKPVASDDVIEFGDPPLPAAPRPAAPAPKPPPKPAAPAAEAIAIDEPAAPAKSAAAARIPTPAPERTPSERLAKAGRKGKTEQLEAARAKMAADLAAVAAKAANSESAKREERKSERLAKVGGATGKPADDKRRSRKAVLTGEGEREHRSRIRWLVGSAVAVGVVLLLMLVMSFRSGIRAALDAYAAPIADTRFMALGNAARARAWLAGTVSQPGGTVIALELADAEFAPQRTIELAPVKDALAQLKGLRRVAGSPWWVPPADEAKARGIITAPLEGGDTVAKALARARVRAVDEKAWLGKLTLPEGDRAVLLDLIGGIPSKEGTDFAKRMLDTGEAPDRLFVRPFSGRHGDLRLDLGPPPYKAFSGPYRGIMLRVEGAGWSPAWRVLTLEAVTDRKP